VLFGAVRATRGLHNLPIAQAAPAFLFGAS
jgi:hypothetical protein